MSNFNSLPDEETPAVTDKAFLGRGTAAGAERKSTLNKIFNLFQIFKIGGAMTIRTDSFLVSNPAGDIESFSAGPDSFQMNQPLVVPPHYITDLVPNNIELNDTLIIYQRTDSASMQLPDTGDIFDGQHLRVINDAPAEFSLTVGVTGGIINGTMGPSDSIILLPGEVVELLAANNVWRIISRYSADPMKIRSFEGAFILASDGSEFPTVLSALIDGSYIMVGSFYVIFDNVSTSQPITISLQAWSDNGGEVLVSREFKVDDILTLSSKTLGPFAFTSNFFGIPPLSDNVKMKFVIQEVGEPTSGTITASVQAAFMPINNGN